MTIERLIPAVGWLRCYRVADLPGDLLAGVIVTIMLIPQSFAYALLANLPPEVGLYASILPLVGYALFGSSRTLAVGPVAVVSLMTATAIGGIAAPGSAEHWTAAIALAFLSGAILLAMGIARLGFLASILGHPVISGFISGSAVLIAASQLKHILGVPVAGETLPQIASGLAARLPQVNLATAAIGLAALGFLFWVRRALGPLLRRWGAPPAVADVLVRAAPVVAVVAGIAVVGLLRLDTRAGVAIVGGIPAGLPPLTVPSLDPGLWLDLLPAALAISVVGLVESLSVAQSLAAKRRQKIDPDQELRGLGAANLAAAFSGGYPVTGGFARSVVNFAAGANTQLAGILTAALIAIVALFFAPAFYYLPNAILAATIIAAVLGLVDLAAARRTWRYSRTDGAALVATALGVLVVGVEAAIALGVGLSILLYLWRTSRPHIAVIGRVPGTEHYRNVLRHAVITSPAVLALRVDESLYFLNARYLEDYLLAAVAERPEVRHVLLVMSAVNFIDASALESLEVLSTRLKDAGVGLHLAEVKGPVMDRLGPSGFLAHLPGRIFLSTHEAMATLAPDRFAEADRRRAG
jgi:SulP family sulfate permease